MSGLLRACKRLKHDPHVDSDAGSCDARDGHLERLLEAVAEGGTEESGVEGGDVTHDNEAGGGTIEEGSAWQRGR